MTKEIQDIIARLEALESAVFAGPPAQAQRKGVREYAGPRGGLDILLAEGLFKHKRGLAEVRTELAERGYHYSRQAVHNALASFSKPGGPLVLLKESGNKYVERK